MLPYNAAQILVTYEHHVKMGNDPLISVEGVTSTLLHRDRFRSKEEIHVTSMRKGIVESHSSLSVDCGEKLAVHDLSGTKSVSILHVLTKKI